MAVLYARSDIVHIAIAAEQGGCGQSHSRPFLSGSPVRLWALDCPTCSYALRDDPLWARDATKIPLTPDEEGVAETMKNEGARMRAEQEALMAHQTTDKLRRELADQRRDEQAEAERARTAQQLAALQSEIARLSGMLGGKAQVPEPEPAPEPAAAAVAEPAAPKAAKRPAEGMCAACGSPLHRRGQRGRPPKGMHPECRAAAA